METFKSFRSLLYKVNGQSFADIALSLFRFQAVYNPLYSRFIQNLSIDYQKIETIADIPFLPISFFKLQTIKTGDWEAESEFISSGTTGMSTSVHYIKELEFYLHNAEKCFNHFFGKLSEYHFLAFLPSYLEKKNSSLIAMIESFIAKSGSPYSGFYLHNIDQLIEDLQALRGDSKKTILWGVSFALLDLAEKKQLDLSHCLLFETGGMKGRRKEITRAELHAILKKQFNVTSIYSEYGMTELLSQAYLLNERFKCPPWMKVIARDVTDPLQKGLVSETGGLNIIDLANWHSIAFIETEDLGKVYADDSFEVLGRMDNSDARGCNLMIE